MALQKTRLFPYVCPEPVLVKRSFLAQNGISNKASSAPVAEADVGREGLPQRIRPTVHNKVLAARRGGHIMRVVTLQALHKGLGKRAGEDWALAVCLVVPTPRPAETPSF